MKKKFEGVEHQMGTITDDTPPWPRPERREGPKRRVASKLGAQYLAKHKFNFLNKAQFQQY